MPRAGVFVIAFSWFDFGYRGAVLRGRRLATTREKDRTANNTSASVCRVASSRWGVALDPVRHRWRVSELRSLLASLNGWPIRPELVSTAAASTRLLLEAKRLDPKRAAEIVSKMDKATGRTPGTVRRDGLPGRGGVG
jgi:hypothetical protein